MHNVCREQLAMAHLINSWETRNMTARLKVSTKEHLIQGCIQFKKKKLVRLALQLDMERRNGVQMRTHQEGGMCMTRLKMANTHMNRLNNSWWRKKVMAQVVEKETRSMGQMQSKTEIWINWPICQNTTRNTQACTMVRLHMVELDSRTMTVIESGLCAQQTQ